MLCRANQVICSNLVEELQKHSTKVNGDYPVDMMDSYKLLVNYKTTHYNTAKISLDDSEVVSFANVGVSKWKYNSYKSGVCCIERKVWCYFCDKLVHITRECPNQNE